jgi:hypothetical protein
MVWVLTCASVYWIVDGVATRSIPVFVEDHRTTGMTDEQMLAVAVQRAYEVENNSWWINDKSAYLVFDPRKTYSLSPELLDAYDLTFVEDGFRRPIAILRPNVAAVTGR